ncbi:MAG: hypothetical protein Ta2D_08840 [Rickettsiales bacterium]|nr:MAG: hypothetical protein Ta2D_08840 [Rickettsiales bacterium]
MIKKKIIMVLFIFFITILVFSYNVYKKQLTMEKFVNINNIYGTWVVKDCRIIKFDIEIAENKDGIINMYKLFPNKIDKDAIKQVKTTKEKEKKACKSYLEKKL